jgi:hypothetical protein
VLAHFSSAASRVAGAKKLRGKYSGPFAVTKKISPTAYQLDLPANIRIHPTVNIEYLKEYHPSPSRLGPRDAPSKPDPVMTPAGDEEYEVDRILAHRYHPTQGYSYLVAWKGYGLHDATWEPESNLDNAVEAIMTYLDALPAEKASPVCVTTRFDSSKGHEKGRKREEKEKKRREKKGKTRHHRKKLKS